MKTIMIQVSDACAEGLAAIAAEYNRTDPGLNSTQETIAGTLVECTYARHARLAAATAALPLCDLTFANSIVKKDLARIP